MTMVLSLRVSTATNGGENSSSLARILELIDSMHAKLWSMRMKWRSKWEDLCSFHLDPKSTTQNSTKTDRKLELIKRNQEPTTSDLESTLADSESTTQKSAKQIWN